MSLERQPRRIGRSGGFTLLEVVVALAIAALALIALFKIGSGGVMAVETASRVDEAVERARSHLVAVGHGAPLAEGEYDGDDGGGFRWHLSVRSLAARGGEDAPGGGSPAALLAVDVAISWQEGGRRKTVNLATLRLQGSG